ncbi:MAG: hypothetical protein Q7R45_08275 [Sulfuricaulis sp.]|nr:hypothetical protein [Sulfuricaulis sp.]
MIHRSAIFFVILIAVISLAMLAHGSVMVPAPPAQYDHPFAGRVNVIGMSTMAARNACQRRGAGRSDACSWVKRNVCNIIIGDTLPVPRADVIRHEIAACNEPVGRHWH